MTLNRPSIFHMALGGLIQAIKELLFFTHQQVSLPRKLRHYSLIKRVRKSYQHKNSIAGIYTSRGRRFFIKVWKGQIPDMKYYFLVNEYLSFRFLYRLIKTKSFSGFCVPKPISAFREGNIFATVYEYIPGKSLTSYSKKYQAKVISKIISDIAKISSLSNPRVLASFPVRHPLIYLFTYPLIALIMLLGNPEEAEVIAMSLSMSFLPLFRLLTVRLSLSHRDLTPENILVCRKQIYLLDCENMALTLPGYDISYLNSIPGYATLSRLLNKRFRLIPDKHLQAYITLQQSMGSKSHSKAYFNYLKRLVSK